MAEPELKSRLEELERFLSRPLPKWVFKRGKMVRSHLQGAKISVIARESGVRASRVSAWIKRYKEGGLDALRDRPRSGRPKVFPVEEEQEIVQRLVEGVPTSISERAFLDAASADDWNRLVRESIKNVSIRRCASELGIEPSKLQAIEKRNAEKIVKRRIGHTLRSTAVSIHCGQQLADSQQTTVRIRYWRAKSTRRNEGVAELLRRADGDRISVECLHEDRLQEELVISVSTPGRWDSKEMSGRILILLDLIKCGLGAEWQKVWVDTHRDYRPATSKGRELAIVNLDEDSAARAAGIDLMIQFGDVELRSRRCDDCHLEKRINEFHLKHGKRSKRCKECKSVRSNPRERDQSGKFTSPPEA